MALRLSTLVLGLIVSCASALAPPTGGGPKLPAKLPAKVPAETPPKVPAKILAKHPAKLPSKIPETPAKKTAAKTPAKTQPTPVVANTGPIPNPFADMEAALRKSGRFGKFLAVLATPGVSERLSQFMATNQVTVFAPVDNAFDKFDQRRISLQPMPAKLLQLLAFHVVSQISPQKLNQDLLGQGYVPPLFPQPFSGRITEYPQKLKSTNPGQQYTLCPAGAVTEAHCGKVELLALNSPGVVVIGIDNVLVPTAWTKAPAVAKLK